MTVQSNNTYGTTVTSFKVEIITETTTKLSWTKPVESGTTNVITPDGYVIAYATTDEAPIFIEDANQLYYEQFGMTLITTIAGGNTLFTTVTTPEEGAENKIFFGIYPYWNIDSDSRINGTMFFAARTPGGVGYNSAQVNRPDAVTISDTGTVYFNNQFTSNLATSSSDYNNRLISKLDASFNLTHLNGLPLTYNTSSLYRWPLAYNNADDNVYTLRKADAEVYKIAPDGNETSFLPVPRAIGNPKDIFMYNDEPHIIYRGSSSSVGMFQVRGIVKVDSSLVQGAIPARPADGTSTVVGIYTDGDTFYYDHQITHPTYLANLVEGQILNTYINPTLVVQKISSTTVIIRNNSSSGWSTNGQATFKLTPTPYVLVLGNLGRWGYKEASGGYVGTPQMPINTGPYNTILTMNSYAKGQLVGDRYFMLEADTISTVNLSTLVVDTTIGHSVSNAERLVIKEIEGESDEYYILSNYIGSKILKFNSGFWEPFAEFDSGEEISDFVWSPIKNWFVCTAYYQSEARSNIRIVGPEGNITDAEGDGNDAAGDDKNANSDNFDIIFNTDKCAKAANFKVCYPDEGGQIPVEPDDTVEPTPPGPYVEGVTPDDVFSFRRNKDILYILRNGIVIWTYKLTPRQMYNTTSNTYKGWWNGTTNTPIYTPPEAIINFDWELNYVFDGTLVEPMASDDILFTYGKHYQGQSLVVWDDGTVKMDRTTLEEDLKTANFYAAGGRVFTLPNGNKATSPFIPYWVLKIMVDNNLQGYLRVAEDI